MIVRLPLLCLAVFAGGCAAKPDLVVSELEIPEVIVRPVAGLGGPTVYTVANIGEAPAERRYETTERWRFVHVDFVISADRNVPPGGAMLESGFREDALLTGGRDQIDLPLAPGASVNVTDHSMSLYPDVPPGGYYICAHIDPYDSVEESSEHNNVTCRPIVIDDDIDPAPFCLDFEQSSSPAAVTGLDATMLYADRGIRFTSAPEIARLPGVADRYQALLQGDISSARPARSCGRMRFVLSDDLNAEEVRFEARNVGFIPFPVHITAIAFGTTSGEEVEVDRVEITSQSELGQLSTFVPITLQSVSDDTVTEPPITQVTVEYGTCPPRVLIDNLCVDLRE